SVARARAFAAGAGGSASGAAVERALGDDFGLQQGRWRGRLVVGLVVSNRRKHFWLCDFTERFQQPEARSLIGEPGRTVPKTRTGGLPRTPAAYRSGDRAPRSSSVSGHGREIASTPAPHAKNSRRALNSIPLANS